MSWYTKPLSFTAGTKAKAADLNTSFDSVATALNELFVMGTLASSGNLTLTGSLQDVPGASGSVGGTLSTLLLAVAVFDFESAGDGLAGAAHGTIRVDSTDQTQYADFGWSSYSVGTYGPRGTVVQVYKISLAAGTHTVTMRAYREAGGGTARASKPDTRLLYLVLPDPT